MPTEVIARAVALKRDLPTRSSETLNNMLKAEYGTTLPKSTLYRHLKEAGATRIKLGIDRKKVRKRWTRNHTHDLWIGDFEEGPYVVLEDKQVVQTHLSAFIDCHSRWMVSARYYFRQNLDILIDTLLRAWAVHGASKQLYLDNAKVYHAEALKSACLRLGIDLIYSLNEVYLGEGRRHERQTGDQPGREAPPAKVQYSYLDMLIRQHEQLLNSQIAGIDYRRIAAARVWPFTTFVQTFARLLGRKGGLSSFTAGELERLKKTYNRSTDLNESILNKAFKKASDKDVPSILNQLEHLLTFRKET